MICNCQEAVLRRLASQGRTRPTDETALAVALLSQSAIGTAFPKDDIQHLAKATSVRAQRRRCSRPRLQQHFSQSNPHSTTPLLTASARPRFPPLGVARLPPLTPPQRSGLHLHGRASGNPYQLRSVPLSCETFWIADIARRSRPSCELRPKIGAPVRSVRRDQCVRWRC
jgi:hypothetical protein